MKIAVLGLGHVGLPTALGLAELGWPVVGAEDDQTKAELIASGEVPYREPGVEELLRKHLDTGNFVVEADVSTAMRDASVLFVCVGTPKREDGSADLSQLDAVARAIASNLNGYKLIVEKSTTPVQTAQQLKRSVLRYSGADTSGSGPDFDVAVNPEFLREGMAIEDVMNPDRIVLGVESDRAAKLLLEIYGPLLERSGRSVESSVVTTDINTAEIIKHASNSFLATKLSFVNIVADLCEAAGANIDDVARGLGMDPRIGPSYLKAGIGYGGSCFPKDLPAFAWIASQHGVDFSLLREVERINEGRVERFLSKVRRSLWVVNGKTLAVWGLAFKQGTDDVREAPSLGIVGGLLEEGAMLRVFDPQAMQEFRRHFPDSNAGSLTYCDGPEEAAQDAEAVLLLTEWPEFHEIDLADIRGRMAVPLIVDGRNMLDPDSVRALGFEYHSIGRP